MHLAQLCIAVLQVFHPRMPLREVHRSALPREIPNVSALEFGQGQYSTGLLKAIDDSIQFKSQDRPQSISEWHLRIRIY